MGARAKDLTVTMSVMFEDGSIVPFEELTPEQLEFCRERWKANLSSRMSAYYSQHLDEFEKLKEVK